MNCKQIVSQLIYRGKVLYTLLILVTIVSVVMYVKYLTRTSQPLSDKYSPNFIDRLHDQTNSRKFIVYTCTSVGRGCGGWGDRQKGIVGAFLIAHMTKRIFKVILTFPCDINTYLLPVEENWQVQGDELLNLPSLRIVKIDHKAKMFCKQLANATLENVFSRNVTYITMNMECVRSLTQNKHYADRLVWTEGKSIGYIYRTIWNHLFQLNNKTANKLRVFQSRVPTRKTLVCAQIRRGKNPTIPSDDIRNSMEDVKSVWNFFTKYNDSERYSLFISTDAEEVRKMSWTLFPRMVEDLGGDIIHVDREGGVRACRGMEKVILDQLVLATCSLLVISRSGFGTMASFLRSSQDDLYCFRRGIISRCTEGSL